MSPFPGHLSLYQCADLRWGPLDSFKMKTDYQKEQIQGLECRNFQSHPTPITGEDREAEDWVITILEKRDSETFRIAEHTDVLGG